jgi:hypothetical protein
LRKCRKQTEKDLVLRDFRAAVTPPIDLVDARVHLVQTVNAKGMEQSTDRILGQGHPKWFKLRNELLLQLGVWLVQGSNKTKWGPTIILNSCTVST